MGIPAAKSVPSSTAQIWAQLFNRGIAIMPKFAGLVAAAYLYAAYDERRRVTTSSTWKGYIGAAVLAVSIVPYTLAFMNPTNTRLHSVAAGASELGAAEVHGLVDKWRSLNLGRAMLPLASAVTGLATFLSTVL